MKKIKLFEEFIREDENMEEEDMKPLAGVKARFQGDDYLVYIMTYQDDSGPAIELMLPDGDLGPRASYNVPGEKLEAGEIIINDMEANHGVLKSLVDAGVISEPVRTTKDGLFPICKLLKTK